MMSPRSRMFSKAMQGLVGAALCSSLVGCGTSAPPKAGSPRATGPLLPWAVGNSWTYRVTDAATVSDKVTTIGAEEIVGGTGPHKDDSAYKVVTKKRGGTDQSVSWQVLEGAKVIRYREQSFVVATGVPALDEHWDPYKLHVDGTAEHTAPGASWLESYAETKTPLGAAGAAAATGTTTPQRDHWVVDAVGEQVTVPAGTFGDAIIFQKSGKTTKTYWYVPGVGKVKESGTQTEELVSYEVAP